MIYRNGKISAGQLYKLSVASFGGISCLVTTQIGVLVGGQNGLLCVAGAVALAVLYTAGILALCERVQWDYETYEERHFHRIVNGFVYSVFGLRYAGMLIGALLLLLKLIKSELLAEISYQALFLPVLLLVFYSVSKSIEARARLAECLFAVLFLSLLIPVLFGLPAMKLSYVLPSFSGSGQNAGAAMAMESDQMITGETALESMGNTIRQLLTGSMLLWWLFSPSEMLLFSSARLPSSKDTKRAAIGAVLTVGALNILYYLVIVGNLSTALVDQKQLSVVRFAQTIKLPYLMFEKQGIFFVLFVLVSVFLSAFSFAYQSALLWSMAGKAFRRLTSKKAVNIVDRPKETVGCSAQTADKNGTGKMHMGKKHTVSMGSRVLLFLLAVAGVTAGAGNIPLFGSILAPADVRIQIEHRQYTDCMIMDFDPQTEVYQVFFSIGEKNGSSGYWEYKTKDLSALRQIYMESCNKRLDLSHVEVVLLQEQMVREPLILDKVVSYIDGEKELSDNLNICVTNQRAEDFVEKAATFTDAPGLYIGQLIQNNRTEAGTRFLSLLLVQKGVKRKCALSCFEAEEGKIVLQSKGKIVCTAP